MCFPIGYGSNPKRDASLFNNFADAGSFIHTGAVLFGAGVLVITVTLLIHAFAFVIRRVTHPSPENKQRLFPPAGR
ncbi:MAG: hypothetical protein JWM33_1430 [Caulobacteraceae bacterium]|nr:hypothetical protein [Caulobacteraceae bacterium]